MAIRGVALVLRLGFASLSTSAEAKYPERTSETSESKDWRNLDNKFYRGVAQLASAHALGA